MRAVIVPWAVLAIGLSLAAGNAARAEQPVLTGAAALGDWHADSPGVRRLLSATDMPKPYASTSSSNGPRVVRAPAGAMPMVPGGFTVAPYATGFDNPRVVRVAPNGDIFVAETGPGRIRLLRGQDGAAHPDKTVVFADGLDAPFGIAFYPPGPDPHWMYIAGVNSVVRYPYHSGALLPDGPAVTVVATLTKTMQGHITRDIAFSPDGRRMYVSVGSESNAAEELARHTSEQIRPWEDEHGRGAAWDEEDGRADVLVFDPDGKSRQTFATGLRNCAGLTVNAGTGDVWCATNERDGLGDDLPPDYVTRVRQGGFYGWPWYYIGGNEDPRHRGERADLMGLVRVPDVLLQPHSAPLQLTFYQPPADGKAAFPAEFRGDAFVTLHGSWNRSKRTGYKVVRIRLHGGVPTGEYEDFLTGFVVNDMSVWGRPVGVAVARDGSLLVSEDGNGTIWRVAYTGAK